VGDLDLIAAAFEERDVALVRRHDQHDLDAYSMTLHVLRQTLNQVANKKHRAC